MLSSSSSRKQKLFPCCPDTHLHVSYYKDHTERRLCILKLKRVIVPTRCSDCQILWQEWKQPPPHLKMQCLRFKASLYSLSNTWKFSRVGDTSRSYLDSQKKKKKEVTDTVVSKCFTITFGRCLNGASASIVLTKEKGGFFPDKKGSGSSPCSSQFYQCLCSVVPSGQAVVRVLYSELYKILLRHPQARLPLRNCNFYRHGS